jgi:hypothetical protein
MRNYAEMDLETVLKATSNLIVNHLADQDYDLDYPTRPINAVLATLDTAEDLVVENSIVGFAIGAKFLLRVAEALNVEIPEGLNDRLHGRVIRT